MNDLLTEEYLMKVFGQGFFVKRLLVCDAFRSHISEYTKKVIETQILKKFNLDQFQVLHKIQLDTAVVPSGCTKFCQVF